jgi:hypothetical protein
MKDAAHSLSARRRFCHVSFFVWVKMNDDAGEPLAKIIERKERERVEGGTFWWGLGSPLGDAALEAAQREGGTLPILFSRSLEKSEAAAADVHVWSKWKDRKGATRTIPRHVKVTSAGGPGRPGNYYALVCRSEEPLQLDEEGPRFDPSTYLTTGGRSPGPSQTIALLRSVLEADGTAGKYRIALRAALVEPWVVKLVA